jgi:hypothetical protein
MSADEVLYHLDRVDAALRTAHDHLGRAESASTGELARGVRLGVVDVEILLRKIPRFRAWARMTGRQLPPASDPEADAASLLARLPRAS